MKKEKRLRIGPLGEAVLLSVGIAGLITMAVVAQNALQLFKPFIRKPRRPKVQEVERNVASLIRSGILKQSQKEDGTAVLTLTTKGKWEFFLRHKSIDRGDTKKWDGMWRIIIFDVPVEKGRVRTDLRRAMKLYGFKMIQRSVWAYPFPCDDFITLLKFHLGVSSDVLYMTVVNIENSTELKREFKLK